MRETTSTVSQADSQPDSEGTLRTELSARVSGAQQALASQLDALTAAGAAPELIGQLRDQMLALTTLRDTIATAKSSNLATVRGDVINLVAASTALVQQARTAGSAANADQAAELAASGVALRSELASAHANLFEKRVFDPFLSFASEEDKEAYRRREAEARRYIDQQMVKGTPEGDLNAAGATMGQMLDAHAHGAGNSPEFLPQWNRLVEATERQRAALRAEGRSTEEFDRNMVASIRRYLRDKGLTEAQIDAALADAANPLDAVKPYLNDEKEAKGLERLAVLADDVVINKEAPTAITVGISLPTAADQSATPIVTDAPDLADVMAAFKAAGVTVASQPAAGTEPPVQIIGKLPSTALAGRE